MSAIDTSKPISIGCDHAGVDYKNEIITHLQSVGLSVNDFGTNSKESVDYPDYAHPVAASVENGESSFGILICGSANGVAITANKHSGIRAAICWGNELASLARQHNDANVICIPARFVDLTTALAMVDIFMNTPFEGGRHENRVKKITCC
jgi:ribose 5-phosphate isomerase B